MRLIVRIVDPSVPASIVETVVAGATAVATLAAVAAAIYAWRALRAQLSIAAAERRQGEERAAAQNAAAAIIDLTTGPVAEARDVVTTWYLAWKHATTDDEYYAPKDGSGYIRADSPADPAASPDAAMARRSAFVMLWALHRLAPMRNDLMRAGDAQCTVLRTHVNLVLKALGRFGSILSLDERAAFAESAFAASEAVLSIAKPCGLTMDEQMDWAMALSDFSITVSES